MGCWDVFCFICGNPCHSLLDGYLDNIEKILNEDIKVSYKPLIKNMIKKIQSRPTIIKELKELNKNTQWMYKCSMLLVNDQVIHNVVETDCNIIFCNKNKGITAEHISLLNNNLFNYPYGIFIHTDCLKYIKKQYKIDLKFSHLPLVKPTYTKLFDINYGDIEKYWEQDFNFTDIILDNKKYLCSNPLKNDKNILQIKKNIKKLKFKNDPKRKGPHVSATFYKEGDIKIGNNKKFWIIKGNKWIEMNENLINIKVEFDISKLSKKQKKYIEKLPFIGEYNINPIFVINLSHKKNNYKLELILTESYKDVLQQDYFKYIID